MSEETIAQESEILARLDLTLREIARDQRVMARVASMPSWNAFADPSAAEEPYPAGSRHYALAPSQFEEWQDCTPSLVLGRIRRIPSHDHDLYARAYEEFVETAVGLDVKPPGFAAFKHAVDFLSKGKRVLVLTESDLLRAIEELGNHKSSLSVGGAPNGAVGGTSESTERDQTAGGAA